MEQWKQIVIDDEVWDYEVCNKEGKVRNMKTGKILKQQIRKSGYYKVNLSKKGVQRTFDVHRLVAIMWIENPNNYDTVNHKDHNRLNNDVENLEWMAFINNAIDGANVIKRRVRCITTGQEWDSITEASKDTGVSISRIHNQCAKKLKGKFTWSKSKKLRFEYID